MRRYTRTFVLLLVASLVIAVAPAASGGSHGLKATFTVWETGVVPPLPPSICPTCIEDIQARCGDDWPGWIFYGEAEGTLTVGKTTYEDAEFTFEHCSRWHAFDPERTTGRQVGKTADGVMEIDIGDDESLLVLTYGGTWLMYDYEFNEEGVPVTYTSDLKYRYAFEAGYGEVFGDVSRGNGHLAMTAGTDGPPFGTGWMAGSLK